MHVYLTPCKDRVVIEGEVPVLLGQRGTPGGYEIQLTWAQALELATILERLVVQMSISLESVCEYTVSAGSAPDDDD